MLSALLTSPLPKIQIANFTRILVGNYASLIRNDFGAEIWKIIRPGTVGNWILAQRNEKRNEKSFELKSAALKENFKIKEMKNLRLGNEELSKRNEGILSCSDKGDENFFEIARALGGNSPFDYPMSSHDPRWPGSSGDDSEPPEDPADYGPGGYHPVSIGDVIHKRYRVIRKLGWGSSSTVWLCCDAVDQRLVALKIVKSAKFYTDAARKEVKMLLACTKEDKNGVNLKCVVQLFDNFTLKGPNGTHVCMVLEVYGDDVLKVILAYERSGLRTMVVGPIVRDVLLGLCQLHENNIVHTDIKPSNVLTSYADIKRKAAEQLASSRDRWDKVDNPPKLDILPGSGLNFQRPWSIKAWARALANDYFAWRNQIWESKIADLGSACWAHDRHIENVHNRRQYRSLELIIGAEFGPPTDIWSTACLAFELVTGEQLFEPQETEDSLELASIVKRLGPVPPHVFKKGTEWRNLFHESGSLVHPREEGLEPRSVREFLAETSLTDCEEEKFADFLASMLKYDPNERATAAECLKHPWLQSACTRFFLGYPDDGIDDPNDESDDEQYFYDHYTEDYNEDDDDTSS